MAFKHFVVGGMPITIYKRKTSRSLKLTVTSHGKVHVSIPAWTPYSAGLAFAESRQIWIRQQLHAPGGLLHNGQAIGKAHRLRYVPAASASRATSRIKQTEIIVHYPAGLSAADAAVQAAAATACVRALRAQAEQLLPQRLRVLANEYGFSFNSVRIKQLKSRWGSCDHQQNIVLNLYLMQLPWDCIDYVLLHELTHTRVMQHGPRFWAAMAEVLPNTQSLRRTMRSYQPVLQTLSELPAASV